MAIPWEYIELFMVYFVRASAFVSLLPIVGNRSVPMMVKVGLTFFLTLFAVSVMGMKPIQIPPGTVSYLLLLAKEVMVGLTLGFISRFIFTGIQISGEMIGMQMGFGMARVMDPNFQGQMSIISEFQLVFAYLFYLAIDGHHFLIRGLIQSYDAIPVASYVGGQGVEVHLVNMAVTMFRAGIKIGAPVVVALLLANVALGVLARTVPQMNIFMVGMPLKIGVGILGLFITISLFHRIFFMVWQQFQKDFYLFFKLLH